MKKKLTELINIINEYEHLAIALSGGVDSIFLLKAASMALNPEKILPITALGPFFPLREAKEAEEAAQALGLRHIRKYYDILAEDNIAANPSDRCYHCKKALFSFMRQEASKEGFKIIADGGNLDDLKDYRPGSKAIIELEVVSPLRQAGLSKSDIRKLSAQVGLNSWNKASFACLASRIPYGQRITPKDLERIEKAEDYLLSLGFKQVRLRAHGQLARVEVSPEERSMFFKNNLLDSVNAYLLSLGFTYAALDFAGYRSGSLNCELNENEINKYSQAAPA